MSPQPLSKVRPGAYPIIHSWPVPFAKEHVGDIERLIARVIMTDAATDVVFARMLAEFLRSDFAVAYAMLEALTSTEARSAVIRAAAATSLTPERFGVLEAVIRFAKPTKKRRNEYAHWLWGYSPAILDALLLIPPALLSEIHVATLDKVAAGEPIEIGRGGIREEDESKVMVYRSSDVERDLRDANEVQLVMRIVRLLLSLPLESPEYEPGLQELCRDNPRFQRVLGPSSI